MQPAAVVLVAALVGVHSAVASAQGVQVGGLLSALAAGRFGDDPNPLLGLRLIPEARVSLASGRGLSLEAEVSADVHGTASFVSGSPARSSGEIDPYRAWVRLSSSRFEARVGLQKISFGSATVFRPLMWFDTLDPRDPLQLTDGVTGLLLRYFTTSNASVSAWALYGNDSPRGWDAAPPDRKSPEFGGRVQVPLGKGEIAATVHRRKAVLTGLVPGLDPRLSATLAPVPEDRFGVDGKWDLGVGVWFEGALVHQRSAALPQPYQLALTAGLDYSFGLGNGLTVVAEHFRLESSARAFTRGSSVNFSGLFLRYPLGLLDELTAILYYDWTGRAVHRFIAWRRTYDAVAFDAIVFGNPERGSAVPGQSASSSYAGAGFQILFTWHY